MSVKGILIMLLAVFGVLLAILAMQDNLGTEWTTVGENLAAVILFIVVFAVGVGAIAVYRRS